jgi:hypothetical protein
MRLDRESAAHSEGRQPRSYPPPPPKRRTGGRTLAIVGSVSAVVGLLSFPGVFGSVGILLTYLSYRRGYEHGRRLCIAAIVATIIGSVLGFLAGQNS